MDEANDDVNNKGPWLSGKKRPNKGRSHTHGRSIHPNEPTGIRKPIIPQKYAVIIEDEDEEEQEKEEEEEASDMDASQIQGDVGTGIQYVRMVSKSRTTPWWKIYVGDPSKSRPYRGEFKRQSRQLSHLRQSRQPSYSRQSRQPSYSRQIGEGGRRSTHKHKRKNKHTRRRRVQRRRV